MEVVEAVLARRSISHLVDPGPSPAELNRMLRAAVAAPDHGRLRPWRFVVLEGERRRGSGKFSRMRTVRVATQVGLSLTP
jgi:nitroreductase